MHSASEPEPTGYLRKRNVQGLFENPQPVISGIQQNVIDRLAGCGAGGADGHADARLVGVGVIQTRPVYGYGKDVIPGRGGIAAASRRRGAGAPRTAATRHQRQ